MSGTVVICKIYSNNMCSYLLYYILEMGIINDCLKMTIPELLHYFFSTLYKQDALTYKQ